MVESDTYDVAVVGGGPTGLMASLVLAEVLAGQDRKLALIAPSGLADDRRTTALLMPSVEMLVNLNLWDEIVPETAALKIMRLIDGSKRLIRAPLTDFKASEIGLDAFGYNVPNMTLNRHLEAAIEANSQIDRYETVVSDVDHGFDSMTLHLSDECDGRDSVSARLAVAADGRDSTMRAHAGIETRRWSYPQTAIVLTFRHTSPHGGVSAEFHTETGPFTQVPLPSTPDAPYRSSLVWVVRPDESDDILNRDAASLSAEVEQKMGSSFGKVSIDSSPQAFPLSGLTARSFAAKRTVLVGEAAHVFPPIGAQGLNLGWRDVRALADLVGQHLKRRSDTGSNPLLSSYHRARLADVNLRTTAVDLLNRSLLTDFLPVQAARALGLTAVSGLAPLRQFMMRQGLGERPFERRATRRERDPVE